tara:strand:+ start:871 stop:1341 length:471 start_codon:yes stop_codon:yes gene_type:complete
MNMTKPIVTDFEKIQKAINEDQLRAVLIDPFKQSVKEVRVKQGNTDDIYGMIGASLFTIASFYPRQVRRGREVFGNVQHDIYLDDEGLYKPDQRYWFNSATGQVLAGKGLVLALDDEGQSSHCLWSDKGVKDRIRWIGDNATLQTMIQMGVFANDV